MDELKPCPFCGSGAVEVCAWENRTDISCFDCDYTIKRHDCDEGDAVDYWNTRPTEDALKAEVERLSELNSEMEKILRRQCARCLLRAHEVRCEWCDIEKILNKIKKEENKQ